MSAKDNPLRECNLINILQNQLKDYVVEPIPPHILKATANKLLHAIENTTNPTTSNIIKIDNHFYWNPNNKQLLHKQKELNLTNMERRLLSLLFSSTSRGFSYEEIFIYLWQDSYLQKHESLKTIVKQLRKKLPKDIIKNIFNYGYRIDTN